MTEHRYEDPDLWKIVLQCQVEAPQMVFGWPSTVGRLPVQQIQRNENGFVIQLIDDSLSSENFLSIDTRHEKAQIVHFGLSPSWLREPRYGSAEPALLLMGLPGLLVLSIPMFIASRISTFRARRSHEMTPRMYAIWKQLQSQLPKFEKNKLREALQEASLNRFSTNDLNISYTTESERARTTFNF